MLVTDPSEAVHSELILATLGRYFELRHLRHLGGPIAYELLNSNDGFFDPEHDTSAEVHRILGGRCAYTDADPARAFAVHLRHRHPACRAARRRPTRRAGPREEDERGTRARGRNGGRYYPVDRDRRADRADRGARTRLAAASEGQPDVPRSPVLDGPWRRARPAVLGRRGEAGSIRR